MKSVDIEIRNCFIKHMIQKDCESGFNIDFGKYILWLHHQKSRVASLMVSPSFWSMWSLTYLMILLLVTWRDIKDKEVITWQNESIVSACGSRVQDKAIIKSLFPDTQSLKLPIKLTIKTNYDLNVDLLKTYLTWPNVVGWSKRVVVAPSDDQVLYFTNYLWLTNCNFPF